MNKGRRPHRRNLTDLARIAAELGMVAIAAARVIEARKRAAKPDLRRRASSLNELLRDRPISRRRKPPEAGLAMPAIPPRGPLPMQGGAAAPLDFDA